MNRPYDELAGAAVLRARPSGLGRGAAPLAGTLRVAGAFAALAFVWRQRFCLSTVLVKRRFFLIRLAPGLFDARGRLRPPRDPSRPRTLLPGPWIQAPRGAAAYGPPTVWTPFALLGEWPDWAALHERVPPRDPRPSLFGAGSLFSARGYRPCGHAPRFAPASPPSGFHRKL